MKKLILIFILPLVVIISCNKEKVSTTVTQTDLKLSDLPVSISAYVEDNYPDADIYQAVVLTNSSARYIVILTTEEELAFDKDSNYIGDGHQFAGDGDPCDSIHHEGPPGGGGHHHGHGHGHGHGHPGNWIPADSLSDAIKAYISLNYADYTIENGQKDTLCPVGNVTSVMLEKSDTVHLRLFFDASDLFLMTGNRIHFTDAPQAVKDYITGNYADYHVCHGTEILTMTDNSIRYAIYLDKQHVLTRVVISADATLICEQVLPHHPL
jgi:hypothetical protein